MAGLSIPRPRTIAVHRSRTALPALSGMAATAGAGIIHLVAAVTASGHTTVLAAVLLLTGMAQLLLAGRLLAGDDRVLNVAVCFQAACLVALWASVTVGLPLLHGHPDMLDLTKALTLVLEAVAVAGLVSRRGRHGRATTVGHAAVRTAVVLAFVVLAPAVASMDLAGGGTDAHDHTHVEQSAHGH